ncbi:MAG: uroporphyrinogen-III synthase [Sphingomonas adhaesiva]|uniref:uroporphyrinogen-III synthase n=1 Tax=Sphingomonas adhaesiva TaxID=28212 RepID=UPI002FFA4D9B
MARRALVLRPEPGNARTCAALRAAGVEAVALPLFAVVPRRWTVPAAERFDALLLTSANAVRHAGEGMQALAHLPVVAVGEATAAAARAAGLSVAVTGDGDAARAVALAARYPRLLHLAGRDRVAAPGVEAVTVYASERVAVPGDAMAAARGAVVLLHSRRAATRFVAMLGAVPRASVRVVALSPAVADVLGAGWDSVTVAARPGDAAMVEAAARVAIDP